MVYNLFQNTMENHFEIIQSKSRLNKDQKEPMAIQRLFNQLNRNGKKK